ncbi:MAG: CDP-alcohol phosphatidyltransferase family protein [Chloroflexi bacterium]|nr:CDP-alcohol phosphatidyltransferase family protein [Chloroflexota bacterium]
MGIYGVKPQFQRALRAVERPLVRRHVHPDVLTFSALGLSLVGGLALYGSRWTPWALLAVPAVALLRIALNALDGMVARDLGVARPWGEVLNEVCDRLSDVAFFGGLAQAPEVSTPLAVAVLVFMLLNSFLGVVSKAAGGPRQYGGVMGKADRMLLLALASVVALALPGRPVFNGLLAFVLVGLLVTLCQRMRKTYVVLQSPQ